MEMPLRTAEWRATARRWRKCGHTDRYSRFHHTPIARVGLRRRRSELREEEANDANVKDKKHVGADGNTKAGRGADHDVGKMCRPKPKQTLV